MKIRMTWEHLMFKVLIVMYFVLVDFKTAWLGLSNSGEQYVLHYESKYMKELGQVFDYLVSIGVTAAVQETLKHTLLSGNFQFY
jgi:Protein of unknown function (DUF726)